MAQIFNNGINAHSKSLPIRHEPSPGSQKKNNNNNNNIFYPKIWFKYDFDPINFHNLII